MSPGSGVNATNVRRAADGRAVVDYDWYAGGIPGNVAFGADVYLDTSYGFAGFFSERQPGLTLGDACGAYDRANFLVGPEGEVTVGPFTVLNGTYIVCRDRVSIGSHGLFAWGAVLTDAWAPTGPPGDSREQRRAALREAAHNPHRPFPQGEVARRVAVGDNVWVGFDAVVLPGVTLGDGCVVGSKTVVARDVPPYAVVAGAPARVVRTLEPDDTPEARRRALHDYARS